MFPPSCLWFSFWSLSFMLEALLRCMVIISFWLSLRRKLGTKNLVGSIENRASLRMIEGLTWGQPPMFLSPYIPYWMLQSPQDDASCLLLGGERSNYSIRLLCSRRKLKISTSSLHLPSYSPFTILSTQSTMPGVPIQRPCGYPLQSFPRQGEVGFLRVAMLLRLSTSPYL